ncbi:MAG: type II toxin-antitoxin system HicB family antitoxin [Spirochaetales bacterium]|nr:type II toxin-antitoxin system HicB family antitoxin [Spirochaetales bacterium]
MQIYPVVFTETKDEKGTVLVYIPDFNGMTEGYGLYDAFSMAKDYIGNCLSTKVDSGFPKPTPIEDVKPESSVFASAGRSFVSLVDVDVDSFRRQSKSKCVRRNITLPEWLDEMAVNEKINVSEVTQNALKQRLGLST